VSVVVACATMNSGVWTGAVGARMRRRAPSDLSSITSADAASKNIMTSTTENVMQNQWGSIPLEKLPTPITTTACFATRT
jgi:hypothetical protein